MATCLGSGPHSICQGSLSVITHDHENDGSLTVRAFHIVLPLNLLQLLLFALCKVRGGHTEVLCWLGTRAPLFSLTAEL